MQKPSALEWILNDAGYTWSQARHITKVMDRLRLCGLGSDDLAGALLRWRMAGIVEARRIVAGHINATPALIDVPSLFDC